MSTSREFLYGFGGEVASIMSDYSNAGPWNVDDGTSDTAIKISGPNGMKIILWCGGIVYDLLPHREGNTDKIKFEVSGEFPPDTYILQEDRPRINVSYKRGARGVARDIERRFLSKYVPLYYKKLQIQQEIERHRKARGRVMQALADAFGWKIVRDKDNRIKHAEADFGYGYRSKVNANLTTLLQAETYKMPRQWEVDLVLKKLTMDQALRIADVLKEPRFPPEQLGLF